jgi:hypothetical protein
VVVAGIGFYYYSSYGTVNVYVTTGNSDPILQYYITVSSVMIHSKTGQWVTISNSTKTVLLSSNLSFLASSKIPVGNYTEVRLVIKSATVSIGGINVSVNVPSGVFKIPIIAGGLRVQGGSTSKLEIIVGPHLIMTGKGNYILSPVVTAMQLS